MAALWASVANPNDHFEALEVPTAPSGHARKLARSLYSGSITSLLREAILDGSIPAGTPLVERVLAERLQTSRGPVRSALQVLEGEGLIRTLENGRMVTVGFADADAADLLAVRWELESTAVRWGLRRRINSEPLRRRCAAMRQDTTNHQRLVDLDVDFHRILVEQSGSRFLYQSWTAIAPVIHAVISIADRQLENTGLDPYKRFVVAHEDLVSSLETGDPDLAIAKLGEQLNTARSLVGAFKNPEPKSEDV